MINPAVYNPALNVARLKSRDARTDCARIGMVGVIDAYRTNSVRAWANRKADGLGPIDGAVTALRANWQAQGGAVLVNDPLVQAVLSACKGWLDGRKVAGMRVTGWREQSISELYWQTAWAYSCDNYAEQARQLVINNNAINAVTPVNAPVGIAAPQGSPYAFAGGYSGYMHEMLAGRVVRGDTRGPLSVQATNGFQSRMLNNRWAYAPWFAGNATGGTVSVTTNVATAIEAGPFAIATGEGNIDPAQIPAWLGNAVQAHSNQQVRGFVYEFGGLAGVQSTRVAEGPTGRENIFLAIPAANVANWWAVLMNRQTVGPFPFPPGPVAPAAGIGLSAAYMLA